jgi:hypothetical protein
MAESAGTHPVFSAAAGASAAPAASSKHKARRGNSASDAAAAADVDPALFRGGRARLRATDMRLRALGAAGGSLYARPTAGRAVGTVRAMRAAEKGREDKRRRDAKEAGIVLERRGGKSGALVGMDKKRRRRVM